MQLWEILVPTEKPEWVVGKKRYFSTRYHREWDKGVRNITGGLSIFPSIKGQWISGDGILFNEKMIPVRIACTKEQITEIIKITAKHYSQLAIMAYKISDDVIFFDNSLNIKL